MERLNHPGRPPRTTARKSWGAAAAVVLAVALAATACTGGGLDATPGESRVDLINELKTRPSYEEAAASYITMLDEIRAALTEIAPNLEWLAEKSKESNYGPCSPPYTKIREASSGNFDSGGAFGGGIPDAVWPQAKAAVVAIAGRHGFTDVFTLKDKPGDHMLIIRDTWKASLELGSLEGTSLSVYGPCLLRSEPAPTITTP